MHQATLNEQSTSQLPALHLLQNLDFEYLTPERAGRLRKVLLEEILVGWLR